MKPFNFLLVIVFVLALGLLLSVPMLAQDGGVTEVATLPAPAVEVTIVPVEEGSVIVVEQPVEVPVSDGQIALDAGVLALIVAGCLLGGGGIGVIFYRLLGNKEARDIAERYYEAASPSQQEIFQSVIKGYEEFSHKVLDFAKAISDGQPNVPQSLTASEIEAIRQQAVRREPGESRADPGTSDFSF